MQAPAEQHARADAGGDLHVDEVLDAAVRAEAGLGQGAQVRVVVHEHFEVQGVLQGGADVLAVPAGHVGRLHDAARVVVDGAGDAHADQGDLRGVQVRVGKDLPGQVAQQGVGGLWAQGDVVPDGAAGQRAAVEVQGVHAGVAGAQVDGEQRGGAGVEVQQRGAPPDTPGAARADFLHQADADQFGDDGADRAAREAQFTGDVHACQIPVPQQPEQQQRVPRADGREVQGVRGVGVGVQHGASSVAGVGPAWKKAQGERQPTGSAAGRGGACVRVCCACLILFVKRTN